MVASSLLVNALGVASLRSAKGARKIHQPTRPTIRRISKRKFDGLLSWASPVDTGSCSDRRRVTLEEMQAFIHGAK
jgi:hypothetical protein